MNIKEIEALSGMERANIRYYEQEGLLAPARAANGYRNYSEADLVTLRRIKLLRTLGLPLETIRALQAGTEALSDALACQMRALERAEAEAAQARALCRAICDEGVGYDGLDAEKYLSRPAPETPAVPYPAAADRPAPGPGRWRRFLARTLDLALCSLPILAVKELALHIQVAAQPPILTALDSIFAALLLLFLEPLSLRLTGTTPGKWLMGIRLEDDFGRRPTYDAALSRTARALWSGMAFSLPVWSLVNLIRSYNRAGRDEPQPWDDELTVSAKPVRWYRALGYVAACGTVFGCVALTLSLAQKPSNGRDLTVAAFAENYNELAQYYQITTPPLEPDGSWGGRADGSTAYLGVFSGPEPTLQYQTDGALLTGVSFSVSKTANGENVLISDRRDLMILLTLALAAGQPEAGPFFSAAEDIPQEIIDHSFEDFTLSRCGVTAVCEVDYAGLYPAGGWLVSLEEEGPAIFEMTFSVTADE